tara:strand:+ start:4191 stop:5069 length:879 start_codon:yes stop_codon:yes gene_type:complete
MKGIDDYMTKDGVRVLRVHYSADEDKDPNTKGGASWMAKSLIGYPGGTSGAKWRREMEIDFNAQGGQLVFSCMDKHRERIYIPSYDVIPEGWKLYGGFDYAGRGTTAFMVVAYDKISDSYYAIHEFYKKKSGYIATSEAIKSYKYFDNLEWIVADPSMWSKTQERGDGGDLVSMAQLFSEQGIHFLRGTRGGDTEFAELINEKMWNGFEKKNKNWQPRYRITKSCINHWNEMSQWRYNEWTTSTGQSRNLKETMIDKNNHSIDAVKYLFKMLSSNWMADKVDSFDMSRHVVS